MNLIAIMCIINCAKLKMMYHLGKKLLIGHNIPFMTFDGEDLYTIIQHKAAQLAFFIISNHPFIDGNKRIGLHVTLILLELDGVDLKYT